MEKDTHTEILLERKIGQFSVEGDKEFSLIKSLDECYAWQNKYTPYFSKQINKELAELNWKRIVENKEKTEETKI